jgi:hypothetical protein
MTASRVHLRGRHESWDTRQQDKLHGSTLIIHDLRGSPIVRQSRSPFMLQDTERGLQRGPSATMSAG